VPSIISAAEITDAEAIHPGYGFLAENASFAEVCNSAGSSHRSEPGEHQADGDKARARETAKKAGVPILPGSEGVITEEADAVALSRELGFPVIIKAVAGGGGKGMRVVMEESEFASAFVMAQSRPLPRSAMPTCMSRSTSPCLATSRCRSSPMTRDYGLARRTGVLDPAQTSEAHRGGAVGDRGRALRKQMGDMAVALARSVKYRNAGTIEFLMDENRNFYFMEMNTRIQVEHP